MDFAVNGVAYRLEAVVDVDVGKAEEATAVGLDGAAAHFIRSDPTGHKVLGAIQLYGQLRCRTKKSTMQGPRMGCL